MYAAVDLQQWIKHDLLEVTSRNSESHAKVLTVTEEADLACFSV